MSPQTLLAFLMPNEAPPPPVYPMPVLFLDWHQSVVVQRRRLPQVERRNHSHLVCYDGWPIGWWRRCVPDEDPR